MFKWILLIVPILFIASCGGGMEWKRPLKEKQASKSAYEQCLEQYPDNELKCDAYRESYNDSIRQMKGANEDPHSDDGYTADKKGKSISMHGGVKDELRFSHNYYIIPVIIVSLFLIPMVSQSLAQSPPAGTYKKTCKDIELLAGGVLWAQCEKTDGSYEKSKLTLLNCEGDIYNDNGKLNCKRKAGKKPPSGSYQQSCKDIRVKSGKLKASCERANGTWNNTKLDYKKCKGDISNNNGELTCKGQGGKIPKGSYRDSCKNSYVEGSMLYSNCKKKNGSWHKTSINYKNCNKNIKNDNGNLVCGGGNHADFPKGSYKKSCKNLYMEGNILEADCKNDNGKWKHSSIKYKNCNKGIWNDNGKLRCNK